VVLTAPTLEELAVCLDRHGVHGETVLATLRRYQAAARAGSWDGLAPPRRRNRGGLTEPPFFAVGVKAAITLTTGGIAVDDELRVLDRQLSTSPLATLIDDVRDLHQAAVPGLFAAGCDAGNLARNGYLGGLLPALVTGRIAGRGAAGHAARAALPVRA
jgi:succinate dehydrogenase/fumarate reductase flavoprotein subunit